MRVKQHTHGGGKGGWGGGRGCVELQDSCTYIIGSAEGTALPAQLLHSQHLTAVDTTAKTMLDTRCDSIHSVFCMGVVLLTFIRKRA